MRLKKHARGALAGVKLLTLSEKIQQLKDRFHEALRPPEYLDLDEHADKYRRIAKGTASEHGPWRTSRFPFLREIMKCLSPSRRTKIVDVIKGSQLGFTEVCINWLLYIPQVSPNGVLYIQKTKDAAEDFSKEKFEPNIEANPQAYNTLGKGKPKQYANETLQKGFPGGYIAMGGSNSGAFLRSKSLNYAMADEVDSFKLNIDGEGSPLAMLWKRLTNFPFSKRYQLSTPKFKETSVIEKSFKKGSQERYYVPCPHCNPEANADGTYFVLGFSEKSEFGSYITWDKDDRGRPTNTDDNGVPKECWLVCKSCGELIEEHHKTWMIDETRARWMSEKGSKGKPYVVDKDTLHRSFQISSLYSPLGFFGWDDAVREFFEALESGDKALLQVFINQTLGETYSAVASVVSSAFLHDRREKYAAEVPLKVVALTCGVDVQDDRLELEVVGWGAMGESWSIDYKVIYGDPDIVGNEQGKDEFGNPTVWRKLSEILHNTFTHESGIQLKIECTLIDSGYLGKKVFAFCSFHEHLNVYPTRGFDGWDKVGFIERPRKKSDPVEIDGVKYKGVYRFKSWVDLAKKQVYTDLKVQNEGPSFCHFPRKEPYNEQHFKNMTAEYIEVSPGKKAKWVCPSGQRNEQLDCRVYALCALHVSGIKLSARARQMAHLKPASKKKRILKQTSASETIDMTKVPQKNRQVKKVVRRKARQVSAGVY